MTGRRIALVYFSATNVTRTYARIMGDEMREQGFEVQIFDVTAHASRQQPLPTIDFDGLIFGFPVFADFSPSVINDWLPTLDGQGKRCAQFFTYGARTTGYAHFHTKQLLEQAGFEVLFSGEFLGRHSFNAGGWRILPDRPDESDFAVARAYVELAIERFSDDAPPAFRLQKPFGYDRALVALEEQKEPAKRGWTHPVRTTETCCMCLDCETVCPTQAFDATAGQSNPQRCIECMRCVTVCPEGVIKVDDRLEGFYERFLAHWHLTEDMMAAKKSKIITEAWQAAF